MSKLSTEQVFEPRVIQRRCAAFLPAIGKTANELGENQKEARGGNYKGT